MVRGTAAALDNLGSSKKSTKNKFKLVDLIRDKRSDSVIVRPKWVVVSTNIMTYDPRLFDLSRAVADLVSKLWPTRAWVKTVNNVCGLACMLGLTGPNDQVSLTTKET